eukprot:GEMP01003901.1.p1 GENE.GEMP01003901.1~~GEMP01003901.1.p1  ORF type:complete len:965 (+),score=255.32 GEMP01003901.1:51-2945(+)
MDERIGCLEFYCRIHGNGNESRRFSIEEDFRKRMYLQYHHPSSPSTWGLTYAFPPSTDQSDVFETLGSSITDWTFDGFNACVLSMGPAQSGKSHSLFGSGSGLASSIIDELFRRASGSGLELAIGLSLWDVKGGVVRDGFARLRNRPNVVEKNTNGYYQFDAYRMWSAAEARTVIEAFDRLGDEGHRFVRACLIDSVRGVLSTANLCDLKSKQADLQSLKPMLENLSASARPFGERPPLANTNAGALTELLYPLIGGNSKTYLLLHIREIAEGAELRDELELLDLAERASLVSTICTRVPSKDIVLESLPYSLQVDTPPVALAPENTEFSETRRSARRRSHPPPEETEISVRACGGSARPADAAGPCKPHALGSTVITQKDELESRQKGRETVGYPEPLITTTRSGTPTLPPQVALPATQDSRGSRTSPVKPRATKSQVITPASRGSNPSLAHPRDVENMVRARARSPLKMGENQSLEHAEQSPRKTNSPANTRCVSWMQAKHEVVDAPTPSTHAAERATTSTSRPRTSQHSRTGTVSERRGSRGDSPAYPSNYTFELDAARSRIRDLEAELVDVRTNVKEFETIKELEVQDIRLELVRVKGMLSREHGSSASAATLEGMPSMAEDEVQALRDEVASLRATLDGKCDPKKIAAKMLAELQESRKMAAEYDKMKRAQKATERFTKDVGQKFVRAQQLVREKNKELEITKEKLQELEDHFRDSCNELRRAENEFNMSKHCIRGLKEEIALLKDECYHKGHRKPEEILTKFLHESTSHSKNKLLEQYHKLQRALDPLLIDVACGGQVSALMGRLKEEIQALVEQNATLETKTSQLVKLVHQQASEDLHETNSTTSRRLSIAASRATSRQGSRVASVATAAAAPPKHTHGDARPSSQRAESRSAPTERNPETRSVRTEVRSTRAETLVAWEECRQTAQSAHRRRPPSVPPRMPSNRSTPRHPFHAVPA